jgi:hypothetical protein
MAYLSLTRFAGKPDALLATYKRFEPTMTAVGRDHSLLVHLAARTDAGLVVMNLWTSPKGSRTASQDPRRLAALRGSGLTAEQIEREHYDVDHYVLLASRPEPVP